MEINLKETTKIEDVWTCKVVLRKEYILHNEVRQRDDSRAFRALSALKTTSQNATSTEPLYPWITQDAEDFHFATISSKEELEDVLFWAQLATLNPGHAYQVYLPGGSGRTPEVKERPTQVKFSPNVVSLEISGPGLPNLSFYDLPGVINVPEEDDEDYLVRLVKNLVREYIKADNCINILALPMTDDAQNSNAAAIIDAMGAKTRTVGVLTKPDRVQRGDSPKQWVDILSGKKQRLGYGYYVVKNNPDPRVDHSIARAEEIEFFRTEEPYTTQLTGLSDHFGTLNLQTALSKMLTAQILKSLPQITQQVQQKAAIVEAELNSLAEPPSGNLQIIVLDRIISFSDAMQQHIDGGSEDFPFQKTWNNLALQFRTAMADLRPMLCLPNTPIVSSSSSRHISQDPFQAATPTPIRGRPASYMVIESDEDDEVACKQEPIKQTPNKRHNTHTSVSTPQKRQKKEAGETSFSNDQKRQKIAGETQYFKDHKPLAERFTLLNIRNIIQEAYIGLPGQLDPKATDRMSKLSAVNWSKPLSQFLDRTENMCQDLISDRLRSTFGSFRSTLLYREARRICDSFIEELMLQQREKAARALSLELYKPITYDAEALEQAREKALVLMRNKHRYHRAECYLIEQERKSGKITSAQARLERPWLERISKVTDEQVGSDPYSQEIYAMATVRGYYECAFSRFVDVICQGIQAEVFSECRDKTKISDKLKQDLGMNELDATQRCAMLLAIDAKTEERRIQLTKDNEMLQKAQEWLDRLAEGTPPR